MEREREKEEKSLEIDETKLLSTVWGVYERRCKWEIKKNENEDKLLTFAHSVKWLWLFLQNDLKPDPNNVETDLLHFRLQFYPSGIESISK